MNINFNENALAQVEALIDFSLKGGGLKVLPIVNSLISYIGTEKKKQQEADAEQK